MRVQYRGLGIGNIHHYGKIIVLRVFLQYLQHFLAQTVQYFLFRLLDFILKSS